MTEELLRRAQVLKATGFSASGLYKRIARGDFPRPFKTGGNSVAWRKSEVDAWQATLAPTLAGGTAAPARHR